MIICPVCEGKRWTHALVEQEVDAVLVEGIGLLAVVGHLVSQPCQTCSGLGEIPDDKSIYLPRRPPTR